MQNDREPNGTDWDNDEAESIAWLDEALTRMIDELGCMRGHWDDAKAAFVAGVDGEYDAAMYAIAKHCETMSRAVGQVWNEFVARYCRPWVVAELAKEKLEQMVGEPVEVIAQVDGGDGVSGYLLRRLGFDVPDDASELDGG